MGGMEWRQVPVGLDAGRWTTRTGCKTVLVVVHTVTTGQRLLEAVRLVESDLRVQVIFTAAPDVFSNGVSDFLRDLGGVVIPWEQATRNEFDLAVAAAYGSVHELHAPLIVLPHGAGYNKLAVRRRIGGAVAARGVFGLDTQSLVSGGMVIPTAIVLSHKADLAMLGRQCPEALPVAVVVGDPCYDRMIASRSLRGSYRDALGARAEQKLVVVASTWGSLSLFGQSFGLLDRMLSELPPDRYRIVTLMHPNVWFGHSPRQVRAWLADAVHRGLGLVPPTSDWVGVLVAADLIVGDHGSTAVYGSAARVPVLLAGFPAEDINRESASALLARLVPRLRGEQPIAEEFTRAETAYDEAISGMVADRLTSKPGRFDSNMRKLMYQLLSLSQPTVIPLTPTAAMPTLIQ
jgi:hypothetical protein